MRSRARRWARCCDEATWPEVLRRYLLASRASLPRPPTAHAGGAAADGDAPEEAASSLDDDAAAVRTAELLTEQPFYRYGSCLTWAHTVPDLAAGAHFSARAMRVQAAAWLTRGGGMSSLLVLARGNHLYRLQVYVPGGVPVESGSWLFAAGSQAAMYPSSHACLLHLRSLVASASLMGATTGWMTGMEALPHGVLRSVRTNPCAAGWMRRCTCACCPRCALTWRTARRCAPSLPRASTRQTQHRQLLIEVPQPAVLHTCMACETQLPAKPCCLPCSRSAS